MTNTELEAIEARAAKATPGPWVLCLTDIPARYCIAKHEGRDVGGIDSRADIEFCVFARSDVPELCASLREAWAEAMRLRGLVKSNEFIEGSGLCVWCGDVTTRGGEHASTCAAFTTNGEVK